MPGRKTGHVNYSFLRGRLLEFQPAAAGNPHMWLLVQDDGGVEHFATVNIQSSKDAPGSPVSNSFLYFLIDNDFSHPVTALMLARPSGLGKITSSYADGALDFVKGNLFDPRRMRVLPTGGGEGDDLVRRLSAQLAIAKDDRHELMVFGSGFGTSPGQTDAAFGRTPARGIDNVHMAQGDPPMVERKIHENGAWHDGGVFIHDTLSGRMTAIFLAFQTQSWQTDAAGQPAGAMTGFEPPRFSFRGGVGQPIPGPAPAAELTSLHRLPDGGGSLVIANMSSEALDLAGWSVLADASRPLPLPEAPLAPGKPLAFDLPPGFVLDAGGIVSLLNPQGAKVDGVSFPGGPAGGWSTAFGAA